jgi:hypothetical protein
MKRDELIIFEPSHLYVRGIVLRDCGSQTILTTKNKLSDAIRYCRQNGFTWLNHLNPNRPERRVQA